MLLLNPRFYKGLVSFKGPKAVENVSCVMPREGISPGRERWPLHPVALKFLHVLDNSRSERIEMDIADQFPEVRAFLTYNRGVAVLKEVAGPSVSSVVACG